MRIAQLASAREQSVGSAKTSGIQKIKACATCGSKGAIRRQCVSRAVNVLRLAQFAVAREQSVGSACFRQCESREKRNIIYISKVKKGR